MRYVKATVIEIFRPTCAIIVCIPIMAGQVRNQKFFKGGEWYRKKNTLNVETDHGRVLTQLNVFNKHSWSTVLL